MPKNVKNVKNVHLCSIVFAKGFIISLIETLTFHLRKNMTDHLLFF